MTINEDVCIDTNISYGLSNLGRGARSFTLSCASQRVEFSHPYLLYWLRRRCFLFYLHNQVLSNWNVIPEILTGLVGCVLLAGITSGNHSGGPNNMVSKNYVTVQHAFK